MEDLIEYSQHEEENFTQAGSNVGLLQPNKLKMENSLFRSITQEELSVMAPQEGCGFDVK